MAPNGFKRLLAGVSWFSRPGRFPIQAYSEFMPPPRIGRKPYGAQDHQVFREGDPLGWHVTEYEEVMELRPGMERLARQLILAMQHLAAGRPAHGIARAKLEGNPYWPAELAQATGQFSHERFVILTPLALSRTQDDKGRVRWTLFGGSEQGPARAFWKGFFMAPGCELAADVGLGFFRRLLTAAYGESPDGFHDLRKAGFRILPGLGDPGLPYPQFEELPSWTQPYLLNDAKPARGVRYLLTFRPFGLLPKAIRRAYLAGELHLLPFPGSLVFWGAPLFLQLRRLLPLAMQIPLLNLFPRHEDPHSLRVPQSGWMHEPHPDHPQPDPARLPLRNTYRRTHRWARIHRNEDELGVAGGEDRVAHVLFSTAPDDLGLYGKPMARNAQIWTHDFRLLLDGPVADRRAIERAAAVVREGGHFGYRFFFPPMHVGRHAIFWHRPLVACLGAASSLPEVVPHAPLGYLTAYLSDRPDPSRAVELWPRLLARPPHLAALSAFAAAPAPPLPPGEGRGEGNLPAASHSHATQPAWPPGLRTGAETSVAFRSAKERGFRGAKDDNPTDVDSPVLTGVSGHREHLRSIYNARKLLEASDLWGEPTLPASFARALLKIPRGETLDDWLRRVGTSASHVRAGQELAEELRRRIGPTVPVTVGQRKGTPLPALGASPGLTPRSCGAAVPAAWAGGTPAPQAIPGQALTYHRTATRSFEVAYWRTIVRLAHGRYVRKENADCARDPVTQSLLACHHRDLEALGDYLLDYYRRLIQQAGMSGKAAVGDLPFRWQTDFQFPWSDGWLGNQEGRLEERDLVMVIPGRDRRRAVIMADHYDTAYMEDRYEKARGGNGARVAAAGADDNHSATAALMLGAPIFLDLSRAGLLGCDVWLVHLTGEEFPSDCMGARHLAQAIVERTLKLRRQGRRGLDLSRVEIEGVYVLDMVAHNNDRDPDVFQISPGAGRDSLRLAYQAHLANVAWNARVPQWNARAGRRGCTRGRRSSDAATIPDKALHPVLDGEVRTQQDPRSSLFNTDGQIFSDAGIPVVLFMENYDINRVGYHDTHDNMTNIDLDYGSAVAAMAIETVARAAAEVGPG